MNKQVKFQKIASHGLIRNKNKILVTHRAAINDWQPSIWDLPGGTIEFGETPEEGLSRELQEEVNLTVKIIKPIFVFSEVTSPSRHQFQIVFECLYQSGEIKLNPEEHDDYKWVKTSELANLPKISFLESLSSNVKLI